MLGERARAITSRIANRLSLRTQALAPVRSGVYQLTLPLHPDPDTGFAFHHQYRGSTPNVQFLSCHISALAPGHSPHPPHTHIEEELLIMLEGEADLLLPNGPADQGQRRLAPDQFVYYPAQFPHSLRAIGQRPANYLMFKWRAGRRAHGTRLAFRHVDLAAIEPPAQARGFASRLLFEAATACLGRLHAHLSFLAPRSGYEPHVDEHDGALVLLDGELETLGQRVRPKGIIHFAAGEPHGMWNPGPHPARYLVFEFHGHVPLLRKLRNVERWKRKLRSLSRTARGRS